MKRYSTNATQTRWDGKQVYKSTVYPPVKPSADDILITASQGDYLDTLAQKYYKDATLWWVIANVNNVGKGRLSVAPGTQLRIPSDIFGLINEFKRLNQQ
jgi:nucleoid-associated protein YgaU